MKTTAKRVWLALGTALLVIAMVAVSGLTGIGGRTVRAAQGTITIAPPSGTDTNQTHTYYITKIFDAEGDGGNISYKKLSGVQNEAAAWSGSKMDQYFDVDTAGNVTAKDVAKIGGTGSDKDNLSQGAITAIQGYITRAHLTPVDTVTTTGPNSKGSNSLENGYYYISTTTGSLVTITSTNPDATIVDKNTVPTVTKKITGTGGTGSISNDGESAIAEAGQTLTYTATVTFGKGSTNVKFHDKMGKGLAKLANETVTVNIKQGNNDITATYPVIIKRGEDASPDDLLIEFSDGIPENAVATITYKALVVADDMTTDNKAAQNTAWVTYGSSSAKTPEEHTKTYNAKFTVTKVDQNNAALAGAGFVLKSNTGKYYKLTETGAGENRTAAISWVDVTPNEGQTQEDAIKDAIKEGKITELKTTNMTGGNVVTFTGLPNGTFTLVESTVPSGYNKAADSTFTINAASDDTDSDNNGIIDALEARNLEQTSTVTNRAGSALPSAGGMGTLIFTIIGAAIVAGAVTLIVKRRKDQQKDA